MRLLLSINLLQRIAKTTASVTMSQPEKSISVGVQRIYLKSQQFVVAGQPEALSKNGRPELSLQANPCYFEQGNNQYEVAVTLNLSAQQAGKRVFQWPIDQAGLITLGNMAAERRERVLYGVCRNALFPYLGVSLNQLLSQAGLPPLYLTTLDFMQLYHQHQAPLLQKEKEELAQEAENNEVVLQ